MTYASRTASTPPFFSSGAHPPDLSAQDETLRAAAVAMRHSSKTQDSTAYNKGKSDRLVQAAIDAAAAFAAKFQA